MGFLRYTGHFLSLILIFFGQELLAEHSFVKIDTCYHWLEESQLAAKIRYAEEHNGALYFHNGNVIYCWRSPAGSQSRFEWHGSLLIRIKLRPGIRVAHMERQYTTAKTARFADLIYSNDQDWHEYTITPQAVESWSVFQPETVLELKADFKYLTEGSPTENDVFYPFKYWDRNQVKAFYAPLIRHIEGLSIPALARIYGQNIENHFVTALSASELPWRSNLPLGKARVGDPGNGGVPSSSQGSSPSLNDPWFVGGAEARTDLPATRVEFLKRGNQIPVDQADRR